MKIGTLLAALAGGLVMFLLGFLFFGILLANYFRDNMVPYPGLYKEPPEFISLFLFNLVWAWLIAFVMDHWAGIRTFAGGVKAGAIIMFAISLGVELQYIAFMNVHKGFAPAILDVVVVTVMGAVAGGVIGVVLGLFHKKQEAAA